MDNEEKTLECPAVFFFFFLNSVCDVKNTVGPTNETVSFDGSGSASGNRVVQDGYLLQVPHCCQLNLGCIMHRRKKKVCLPFFTHEQEDWNWKMEFFQFQSCSCSLCTGPKNAFKIGLTSACPP